MADSSIVLWLPSVVLAALVGIMGKLELTLAAIGAGGLWFSLNKVLEPKESKLWWWAVAAFALLTLLCIADSFRRVIKTNQLKKVLAELSELKLKGAVLINEGNNDIKNDEQAEKWWEGVTTSWLPKVKSSMAKIHPADATNWETLGSFLPKTFPNAYNPMVNHRLTILSEWLEKLQKYIDERTR